MGRKTIALSLDEETYKKYQDYCKKHSIILSRKIDKFMEDDLKRSHSQ